MSSRDPPVSFSYRWTLPCLVSHVGSGFLWNLDSDTHIKWQGLYYPTHGVLVPGTISASLELKPQLHGVWWGYPDGTLILVIEEMMNMWYLPSHSIPIDGSWWWWKISWGWNQYPCLLLLSPRQSDTLLLSNRSGVGLPDCGVYSKQQNSSSGSFVHSENTKLCNFSFPALEMPPRWNNTPILLDPVFCWRGGIHSHYWVQMYSNYSNQEVSALWFISF